MYRYLSGRLKQLGYHQYDLADVLGLQPPAISNRFRGHIAWSIEEMYILLDLCRGKSDELHLYFPRGGVSHEEL